MVGQNDKHVMVFDCRRPTQGHDFLNHGSVVNAIAWCPNRDSLICSVGDGGNALIWDLAEDSAGAQAAGLSDNDRGANSNTDVGSGGITTGAG